MAVHKNQYSKTEEKNNNIRIVVLFQMKMMLHWSLTVVINVSVMLSGHSYRLNITVRGGVSHATTMDEADKALRQVTDRHLSDCHLVFLSTTSHSPLLDNFLR